MPTILPAFFAYPSHPELIGVTIEQAVQYLRSNFGVNNIHSWRESDIAGRFIADQVLSKIDEHPAFIADVTQLNFNVTYEVGYALAREKRVVLTRRAGVTPLSPFISDVGIFDTLGYSEYQNGNELERILRSVVDPTVATPFD